jgi:hypothetical protein
MGNEKGWTIAQVGTPVIKGPILSCYPMFRPTSHISPYSEDLSLPVSHHILHYSPKYQTMPTYSPTPGPADFPPPYNPLDLPDYDYTDTPPYPQEGDRGNYARAIMMHNLRFNFPSQHETTPLDGRPPPSPPDSCAPTPQPQAPTRSPTPPPSPPHTISHQSTVVPSRASTTGGSDRTQRRRLKAALREFKATQNPDLWGRRMGHGRQERFLPEPEEEGFWAWLDDLFLIRDERGNPVPLGSTSPWGIIGPGGLM